MCIRDRPGTYFAGNFDGQGNTISNLYIDGSKYSDHDSTLYGLFGWLNNASISNLTLNNSVIINGTSDSFAGALAGQAQDSIITNASSKNAAIVSEGLTGGLIGYAQYNTIIANSTTQNLSAKASTVGGLIGKAIAYNGMIINSVSYTHLDVYKRQGCCCLLRKGQPLRKHMIRLILKLRK